MDPFYIEIESTAKLYAFGSGKVMIDVESMEVFNRMTERHGDVREHKTFLVADLAYNVSVQCSKKPKR